MIRAAVAAVFICVGHDRAQPPSRRRRGVCGNRIGASYFDGCAGVTITDNRVTFPATTRVDAVEVRNCEHVVVDRNAFPGAGELLVDNTGAPNPSS